MNNRDNAALNALFDCLASSQRRALLASLLARAPASATRRELATHLAARSQDKPRERVSDAEREQAATRLHHVHLPKLEAAELIERDADRDETALGDHPAFEDDGVTDVLAGRTEANSESLDALFEALADARRRTVLDVLSHQYQQIQVETLAREVAAAEADTTEREVSDEVVEKAIISLRHVHLPRLSEAGLVRYDVEERVVEYRGHPDLRVPWMHSVLASDFRESLTSDSESAQVSTVEGRENVVSYGQSLCEDADEELFLMFTETGLLESGCFARVKRAADRGVDVYLGTRDPVVREFARERAPEITLWDPQANWLNLPAEGDTVGRLVFADRESIMLGTLGEKTEEGTREEQAIVGDGEGNALVVMTRQLLGSRFEQIDERPEDLPFSLL